jgi:hypothetical protein
MEVRNMKWKALSIGAVLVFTVLVVGVAYAHMDHNGWCTGNTGRSDMMDSSNGHMMSSSQGHMMGSSQGEMMDSSQGHMAGPSAEHMTARHDGKDQSYDCPGWDTGSKSKDTGSRSNESGSKDSGSKGEESR